ncbi:MAG: hypothetical protein ACYTEL_12165 [Planctomycetota bacterium]|jgi:hypothetical protein
MEDESNVSSEEELLRLRDEGRINEQEYEQLLGAMRGRPEYAPTGPRGAKPLLPGSLNVVAGLFIIGGIFAVIEMVIALTQNRISINFGVLGLFIGPGLLKLRPGWRTCALVFIWIGLVALPIIFLLGLSGMGPGYFNVFGVPLARIPGWWVSIGVIPFFLVVLWEYKVLTRPDIKALFGLRNS